MDPLTNLPTPPASLRRPRYRSCQNCRQSKRRCNGARPCSTCVRYRFDCHYHADAATPRSRSPRTPRPEPVAVAEPVVPLSGRANVVALSSGGFLAPEKPRFIEAHSPAAQPLSLGLQLGLPEPPRLHAFAYHLGVRTEPACRVRVRTPGLVSWAQARAFLDVYLSVVHPVFGFLDRDALYQRSRDHWHDQPQPVAFDAVAAGVVALGSLFAGQSLPEETETEIALHAKTVLEDPAVTCMPSLDVLSAWILRTVYVRAITRPYVACLSSITCINLVQVMGLHKEDRPHASGTEWKAELEERAACVAQTLHILCTFDYGRTTVNFGRTSRGCIVPRRGDFTLQMAGLADAVSSATEMTPPDEAKDELDKALGVLVASPGGHDMVTLTKAELGLAIFRRLRQLGPGLGPTDAQTQAIIDLGAAAVPAARRLAAQKHPWWSIIHVVFQYLCVLLSVSNVKSLSNLGPATETLELVDQQFQTHLTQEALATARLLVRASLSAENDKAALLRAALPPAVSTAEPDPMAAGDTARDPAITWDLDTLLQPMVDGPFDLSDFL